MGLIKAALGAVGGVLADQWKEYFYCDALKPDILVTKGQKRVSGRSSNTKASDNIISNGSVVAVADGQCMIIVDQGRVAEVCAEPGEFVFDTSSEPSIFAGKLGTSIIDSFKTMGRRIGFGGDTAKDQRVYYFNTKEIVDNKFGTQNPIPFRVLYQNIGLDLEVSVRCNGMYSFKIVDPILFYTNICGNVEHEYNRSEITDMMRSELLQALQPAFAALAEQGIRYYQIVSKNKELADLLNNELSADWTKRRGITIESMNLVSVTIPEEEKERINKYQEAAVLRDPTMAGATLVGAQAEAMKAAASNENGAMMGFMGLGMAQQAGGMNAQGFYAMGQQGQQTQADGWTCACGTQNTGRFCVNCGKENPVGNSWVCSCGNKNKGKFCSACGKKKPAGVPLYRCDKCGWEPEDPQHPPKFCPECGDPFDDNDIK